MIEKRTITLIDNKLRGHHFTLEIIKKGLYVELNSVLDKLEQKYLEKNPITLNYENYNDMMEIDNTMYDLEQIR